MMMMMLVVVVVVILIGRTVCFQLDRYLPAVLVGQLVVCFFCTLFAPTTTATATVWLDLNRHLLTTIFFFFSTTTCLPSGSVCLCLFLVYRFTDVAFV